MNPVLLLHGALGASTQLDSLKNNLAEYGYDVHLLNFSGHGGQPFQSDFGIAQFSDDVLRYVAQHQLKQVDIFGYSMGGYVALWLAHAHSQIIGKIVTLGTKFDWSMESASQEVKKLNAEKIVEKVPAFARLLEQRHAPNDWKELLKKTADMMLELGNSPLLTEAVLPHIKTSTLICLGDADDMADRSYSEQVAQRLPSAAFRLLPNTPHPIEKCDQQMLVTLLNTFLNE
jgi:pimeloyl-ACP methyl ester carboxylesterase